MIGAIFGSYFQSCEQFEFKRRERREEAYAKLIGDRFATQQAFYVFYEAQVFFEYHQGVYAAEHIDVDQQEAIRFLHRSEELGNAASQALKTLLTDTASAAAAFGETEELKRLTKAVYETKTFNVADAPKGATREELRQWRDGAVAELQRKADREIAQPVRNLTEYLEPIVSSR